MPGACLNDVRDYRTFLAEEAPIAEIETRFLDDINDLIRVPNTTQDSQDDECDLDATPVKRNGHMQFRNTNGTSETATSNSEDWAVAETKSIHGIVAGLGVMSVSVLVPVLAFLVVPGFAGRMVVSLLVCAGILAGLVSSCYTQPPPMTELMMFVAFYGSVMAVLAGVVG